MRDDFGVRFGLKLDSLGLQLLLQHSVVFDDAVVHNRNVAIKALVRVGVFLGRGAVGSPAGVRDTDVPMKRVFLDFGFKCADLARCAHGLDFAVVDQGDS